MTAAGAIAAAERGEIILPPPTWVTLDELARFRTGPDLLSWIHRRDIPRRQPDLVEQGGSRTLIMPADPGYAPAGARGDRVETRFVWSSDRWLPERGNQAR
jgi:hypothetical protein